MPNNYLNEIAILGGLNALVADAEKHGGTCNGKITLMQWKGKPPSLDFRMGQDYQPVHGDLSRLIRLINLVPALPEEGQAWISTLSASELAITEGLVETVGESYFIQHWTDFRGNAKTRVTSRTGSERATAMAGPP